ncbi:MAG TPA: hypothetical protein VF145_12935, partial [Chitinophagaceae bacterium]
DDVRALRFQILIVTDLSTGVKTKGLYLDNQNQSVWEAKNAYSRFAYLDETELDELIVFLENCDKTWKNEKPANHTEFVYLTNDNLKIVFWTQASNNWQYSIEFTNYIFDNKIEMTKKRSDDLVEALRKIKTQMAIL